MAPQSHPIMRKTAMTSKQDDTDKKKLTRHVLLLAFLMLVGMTTYEIIKQIISPNITIWQSHIITIIFSTACASAAAFYILRKQIELTSILTSKITESERLRKELEDTVKKLEAAMSEVKTLSGLLPICASCKDIRDDKGYWSQIESYIRDHSEISFSHSICPKCAKKLYPEFCGEEKDT